MKYLLLPATFMMLIFLGCRSSTSESKTTANREDTVQKNYLPVLDYIKDEISYVDSTPFRLMRYATINGKKDSGIITTVVFDQIAKAFLRPELDSSHFEKHFDENSFVDRSTERVSFTYSTKDTGNGLKRVDILLTPGPASNKLSSIYMESVEKINDTSVISKMSWKARQSLSILRISNPLKGSESIGQTTVVWDSRD